MSELGRLLREARAARRVSLADVEATTRIRQKYLEALETGEFGKLPLGTVARGFVRTYASYLGLDEGSILKLYAQESGDAGDEIEIAEPGKPRIVDYRPLEVELIDSEPRVRWWPWLVALLIVGGLVAAGWWFLSTNQGRNLIAAFGPKPTPSSTPTPGPTLTPIVITATPRPTATDTPTLPTPTSDLLTMPTNTVQPSVTPTRRPTATPEVLESILLELQVTSRSWVRIEVDGQVVEEGTLEGGAIRSWEAQTSIIIRTGNAGGLTLTLNGEDLGPMGGVDEVLTRLWIVDQGQVTETEPGQESTATPSATPTATSTP